MKQVFVSYSSQEAQQANEIVEALEKQGIECWIAPRDIPIGSDYIDQIPEGIEACPCFLVLLSPKSQSSQWVRMELSQAVDERKCIFPLLLEDFTVSRGFKFLLRNTQTRPYYRTKEQTMREVLEEIRVSMPQTAPVPKPEELTAQECFQKGLAADHILNYPEAVEWYRKAANQGHSNAQIALGDCHYSGKVVLQDYKTAMFWYQKAAEHGNPYAHYKLGMCHFRGYGVPQNHKNAAICFQKAAKLGDFYAQYFLGVCYEKGYGVKRNLTEAKKWYQESAAQGNLDASRALNRLK